MKNEEMNKLQNLGISFIKVENKSDLVLSALLNVLKTDKEFVLISAKNRDYLDILKNKIIAKVNIEGYKTGDTDVTNLRHNESLYRIQQALKDVIKDLDKGVTVDFLAMDIRQALHYLGEITGEVTTYGLLSNISSKICIGSEF